MDNNEKGYEILDRTREMDLFNNGNELFNKARRYSTFTQDLNLIRDALANLSPVVESVSATLESEEPAEDYLLFIIKTCRSVHKSIQEKIENNDDFKDIQGENNLPPEIKKEYDKLYNDFTMLISSLEKEFRFRKEQDDAMHEKSCGIKEGEDR